MPTASTVGSRPSAYLELTKPGIAVFVTITAGVGYYLGAGGAVDLSRLLNTLIGTLTATAGALALNQYIERDVDKVMLRTRSRPVPSERVTPQAALSFGMVLFLFGTTYLTLLVGWLPGLVTLVSAIAYALVYTPLKSRSYMATPTGAIPGAMPVLIGWTAATGGLSAGAWILFALGFAWQIPHVLSLGWMLREDYARVGFRLIPSSDPQGRRIGRHLVVAAAVLVPVSLGPSLAGLTGSLYFWSALGVGVLFLVRCLPAVNGMNDRLARGVFFGTLAYHPVIMSLLVLDVVIR